MLQIEYEITTDASYFESVEKPKLVYGSDKENHSIFINAHTLLFETGIKSILPTANKNYQDFPKFFESKIPDFLGYDVFAMVFYFASRYEEYNANDKDEHQRFKAENSLAYQYNCLAIPFLNYAILDFSQKLKHVFPQLHFTKRNFNCLSTVDIDNAFAFAHKGIKRNLAGFVKDLLSFKFKNITQRIVSNVNEKKDPYNTFDIIHQLTNEHNVELRYFVLIGDYSAFDKNPHFKNEGFKRLLQRLSQQYSMGLHPSYKSFEDVKKIGIEKERLENSIHKKVLASRCHFLRLKFPDTYRSLVKQGITDDYTMIHASQVGFRTGLCMPYHWFDLEQNESTKLVLHTSVIMEGTLRDYNKLSPEKALTLSVNLMNEVKKFGGEFISIFHNDSFVEEQKEWIEFYKKLLQQANNS